MTEKRSERAAGGGAQDLRLRGGASEQLLARAERAAGLGYWRISLPDGRWFWSDEVYRIHGVDPASFDPNRDSAYHLYPREDRVTIRKAVMRAMEQGESFEVELRIRTPVGEMRQVKIRGVCERV